jgi:hypothetical protein
MEIKEFLILLVHTLVIWAICTAVMGIGQATMSIDMALIAHAAAAPFVAIAVSFVYFKKFNYTSPILTAVAVILTVILLDFFVVATLILGNYEMFYSPIGTWIPFALMFITTYLTGWYVEKDST